MDVSCQRRHLDSARKAVKILSAFVGLAGAGELLRKMLPAGAFGKEAYLLLPSVGLL